MLQRLICVAVLVCVALASREARADSSVLAPSAQLRSLHSGRCLQVAAAGPSVGPCWPDRRLAIEPATGDPSAVRLRDVASGLCLYANADGRFGTTPCAQEYADQHWELMGEGDRRMIRSVNANVCLYSNADGRFARYPCTPGNADHWWLIQRNPEATRVKLRSANSGRCLDLAAGPTTSACDTNAGLVLQPVAGTAYFLLSRDGRCIYANADGRFSVYGCSPYADQQWELVATGDDTRLLRSVHDGRCLYSNRDGRFGQFPCTPAYDDHHWNIVVPDLPATATAPPAAPPAAPPPAPAPAAKTTILVEGDIEVEVPAGTTRDQLATKGDFAGRTTFSEPVLWPDGIIPYTIEPSAAPYVATVQRAMGELQKHTNLTFVPWVLAVHGMDHIMIKDASGDGEDLNVCSSIVGKGYYYVKLRSKCGDDLGVVLHELLHAAGFPHEHSRADRDDYVVIHPENIKSAAHAKDFDIVYEAEALGPYDFKSVMHYQDDAFARSGTKTITTKRSGDKIDPGDELSPLDIAGINRAYPKPGPRAYLYRDTYMRGDVLPVYGEVPSLGDLGMNDVSSIRLDGVTSVALYEHRDFGGRCIVVTTTGALAEWNDRPSSLKVNQPCADVPAAIYEHVNYGGTREVIEGDRADLGRLTREGSSVRLRPGVVIAAYSGAGFTGSCTTYRADADSLGVQNDTISSVRFGVECPPPALTVFEDAGGRGASLTIVSDVPSLGALDFGDTISTLRPAGIPVAVYADANYGGRCLDVRAPIENLKDVDMNDSISSIRVGRWCSTTALVVYEDDHFRGRGLEIDADVPFLATMNDSVTSVRVRDGVTAALFADSDYRGACTTVTGDVQSLSGSNIGNDRVSSIRVGVACPPAAIVLFVDTNFRGRTLAVSGDIANLKTHGFNDTASSVQVVGGITAALYKDSEFRGKCVTVTADVTRLGATVVGNDRVSSIRIGRGC